jgi:histone deacetylase complex regulatory component SIN3
VFDTNAFAQHPTPIHPRDLAIRCLSDLSTKDPTHVAIMLLLPLHPRAVLATRSNRSLVNDDAHFFNRVELFMADQDIHNEFLKLVHLFGLTTTTFFPGVSISSRVE